MTARPHTSPEVKRKAVVVELFTSEGCSSCPPADALLARLKQQGQQHGVEIIPLGFHVDYWNYLGWKDRFSSRAYSQRQEQYAGAFSINGPYTPQMVIDGQKEFVGSDSSRASGAIADEAGRPQTADVQLAWVETGKLQVHVTAPESVAGEVKLAITEDNLVSSVGSGENGGRTLRHAAVVREFRTLGKLAHGSFQTEETVSSAKDWKLNDLRYVVFVQQGEKSIEGAASLAAGR
ncbi:MAG TPA: DUF1223 domain-containing protein [Candidatus Angelobacter sp.]|nr:DUF1223 domain-containing protein [Candidatus Angelobacter sp.]